LYLDPSFLVARGRNAHKSPRSHEAWGLYYYTQTLEDWLTQRYGYAT